MKPKKKTAKLPEWSFPPIDRPSYTDQLKFPENLPALQSRELGTLHGRYVGLHAYASSELAKITVAILRLESEVGRVRHMRMINLARQGTAKWELENLIESNPKVMELRDRLLVEQSKKETVFSYVLNFERYAAALSREMSRRASETRLS